MNNYELIDFCRKNLEKESRYIYFNGALLSKLEMAQIIIHDYEYKNKIIEKLKQENEKLKKALEFYADEYSYDLDGYCGVSGKMRYRCVLNRDREERNDIYSYAGKLARLTLKEIEEQNEKNYN